MPAVYLYQLFLLSKCNFLVIMFNVPDYIKETDTSNRFNQYANEGETGSKEETVDETGSNGETEGEWNIILYNNSV